jgi:hypothetical protein
VHARQRGQIRARFLTVLGTAAFMFGVVGVVYATDLNPDDQGTAWDDPTYTSLCEGALPDAGLVRWHFVLTDASDGPRPVTLTAELSGGTFAVEDDGFANAVRFDLFTGRGETLQSASTDHDGQTLLLQYICVGEDPQPSFGPSQNPGAGNTPPGGNVQTAPAENGVPTNHQLTFQNVSGGGVTTVTTSSTGPEIPAGFQLGDPPLFYDLQTTATYDGSITVCLFYGGTQPAPTALLHFEGGAWVDITVNVDTFSHLICGVTTSLSPFVAVHAAPPVLAAFSQPLNDPISASSPMSVFKRNSTVPVKFALRNADGSLVSDEAGAAIAAACRARISLVHAGTGAPAIDETVVSSAPHAGTCFRYDAGANLFIFNLGTKGLAAPATYNLTATIYGPDSSVLSAHALAIGLR